MPPVDTIQNDVEKILGRPVKAAQPRLEARPKDGIKNDVESILGRQVKPYQQSNVGQLEPPPAQMSAPPAEIKARGNSFVDRLEDFKNTLLYEGLPSIGLKPLTSGVSQQTAQTMGSPLLGPVEAATGLARSYGSKSDEDTRPYWRRALQGASEMIGGAFQTVQLPLAVTDPGFMGAMAAYVPVQKAVEKVTENLPVGPEIKDLINTVLPVMVFTGAEITARKIDENIHVYSHVKDQAEVESQASHGKAWNELSPPERDAVAQKLGPKLKNDRQKNAFLDIQHKSTIEDAKAAQIARNEAVTSGEPVKVPPRLKGTDPDAILKIAAEADKALPEGREKPPVSADRLTPDGIREMPAEDLDKVSRYAARATETPENSRLREAVKQENLRRQQAEDLKGKAGQGLRDLIALNNREVVRKTVDRMIANAPEKRPSERQPALLEGQPLTPDQQFDEMVESVKAERGQKEAADARRVLDEHERLMNLIRQGRDTAEKEAADQAAREAEERPKVVDRRRVAFEPPPESDRLKFEAKPHDEVAILEGMPQGRDEAFDRRRDELLEEIKREQEARLTESLARLRRLASKTQGILDRSLEGYIERTENEARDRGFKIVDLRGTRGAQEPATAAPPGKPTEAATIPAPSAAEPAASPAPATPESSAAVPPDLKAPPKKLAKPPKEEPRAAIPSTLKGIAGSPFTLNVEGHNYEVRAVVVPGESLKISHNPQTFQITPGGAADEARWGRRLQPRYYETDKDAQSSVIADSTPETFNPHKIFAVDPTTTIGPPVVLPDGTVMGGNSRAMKVMRMYNMGHGDIVRNGLVNGLKNHLDFGIKADDVPSEAEKPILVWELTNPPRDAKNLAIMGDDLNRPPTRGLDEVQQGMALSNRISDETVDWMSNQFETLGDNASMRDIIRDNEPYLISVMIKDGVFPRGQLSELVDTRSGKLTDKAKNLIESAMRGKAFDDPAILAKTSPGLLQKLDRALPQLIRMRARDDNWDMRKYVNEAVKAHNAAASVGEKLEYWIHPERDPELEKEPMLGMEPLKPLEAISPITEALAYKLEQSGLSFNKALRAYLNDPMMFEEKSQGRMTYGEKKPLPWDSFKKWFGDEFGIHTDIGDWLNMEPPPVELPVKPIKEKRSTEPSNIKERLLVDDYKTHGIPREQWAGLIEAERTRDEVSRRQKSELSPEQEKMLAQGKSTNEILAMGNKSEEPPAPLEPPKKAKKAKAAKVEPPPVEAKAEEPPPPQVVRQRANAFAALERGLPDSELKHLAFENGLELTESGKLKFVDQRGGGGNYTVPKKDFVDWILGNKQGDDPLSYSKDPEWIELIGRARKIAGDEEPPPPLEAAKGSPTLDYAEEIKKIPDKDLFSLQHRTQLEGKEDSETKAKLKAMQAELERREKLNGGNWGDDNTVITKDDAAKLRESIRKKTLGGGLKAGLDPTLLLDMAKLGAFHFEAGAREFIRWSDNMVSDIGDWIRPHLRDVWTRLPIIAREEAQRKIQAGTPPAIAEKLRARARLFSEIERKPLGLVDISGKEVETSGKREGANVSGEDVHAPAGEEESRRLEPAPKGDVGEAVAGRPLEPKPDELAATAGKPRRSASERAGGKQAERPTEFRDVPAARIEPVKGERPPVVDEATWKRNLYRYMIPDTTPPPTVSISPAIEFQLFDYQKPLVQRTVSTLVDNDSAILAAPKGKGKTVMGSAAIAEMLDRMGDKGKSAMVLIMAPSRPIGAKWAKEASKFGLNVEEFPKKVSVPDKPGIYVMTYGAAIYRPGIEKFKWDMVVTDEAQRARNWFKDKTVKPGKAQAFTTTGMLVRDVTMNALKSLYVSATPWHHPAELGYMEKLGLWKPGEFNDWVKQFGITMTPDGPKGFLNAGKLVKLWSQLTQDGRLIQMDHDMQGQKIHCVMVPLSEAQHTEVSNIRKAFQMAEGFFRSKGQEGMVKAAQGHARLFMKAYLTRAKLPAIIEMTKKVNTEGWKAVMFSETRSPVKEVYDFLKPADDHYGGAIGKLIPKLPGTADVLSEGLEGKVSRYYGSHSAERERQLKSFQDDETKNLYATYGAGAEGVDMDDTAGDKPRATFYIDLPWSGMTFDQGLGRTNRATTKSDVMHIFVSTNSKPEVDLLLGKVVPRLESLRAMVNGIRQGDEVSNRLRDHAGVIAYIAGAEEQPNYGEFQQNVTSDIVSNYHEFHPPSATEAMHKPRAQERLEAPPEPRIVLSEKPVTATQAAKPTPQKQGGVTLYSGLDPEAVKKALKQTAKDLAGVAFKVSKSMNEELTGKMSGISDDPDIARAIEEIKKITSAPENKQTLKEMFPSLTNLKELDRILSTSAKAAAIDSPLDPVGAVAESWRDNFEFFNNLRKFGKGAIDLKDGLMLHAIRNGRRNIIHLGVDAEGSHHPGIEIEHNIRLYHVLSENYAGPYKRAIVDLLHKVKLSDAEIENAWDAVEHDVAPVSDGARQLRDVLRANYRDVAVKAKEMGVKVEIQSPDGQVRYANFPEPDDHYSPHIYDEEIYQKGSKKHERFVNMIASKKGITVDQARDFVEHMRSRDVPLAGNLEKPRQYDIPGYEKNIAAAMKYFDNAGEVIARSEVFGQRRGKVEPLILDIKGYDNQAEVREILDQLLSRQHMKSKHAKTLSNFLTNWTIMSKMSLSAFKMLTHTEKAAMVVGDRAYISAFFKLLPIVGDNRGALMDALDSGAVGDRVGSEMLRELGKRGGTDLKSDFLRWYQIFRVDKYSRLISDASARKWMQKIALPKLMQRADHPYFNRILKDDFMVTQAHIDEALKNGYWSNEAMNRAGAALANMTQGTFDPTELPRLARLKADTRGGEYAAAILRSAFTLKGYVFRNGEFYSRWLLREAGRGNFRPLIPFLTLVLPMSEVLAGVGKAAHGDLSYLEETAKFFTGDSDGKTALRHLVIAGGMITTASIVTSLLEGVVDKMLYGKPISNWSLPEVIGGVPASDLSYIGLHMARALEDFTNGDGEKGMKELRRIPTHTITPLRSLAPKPSSGGSRQGLEFEAAPNEYQAPSEYRQSQ